MLDATFSTEVKSQSRGLYQSWRVIAQPVILPYLVEWKCFLSGKTENMATVCKDWIWAPVSQRKTGPALVWAILAPTSSF